MSHVKNNAGHFLLIENRREQDPFLHCYTLMNTLWVSWQKRSPSMQNRSRKLLSEMMYLRARGEIGFTAVPNGKTGGVFLTTRLALCRQSPVWLNFCLLFRQRDLNLCVHPCITLTKTFKASSYLSGIPNRAHNPATCRNAPELQH